MNDRNCELQRFKLELGGHFSRSYSEEYDVANYSKDIAGKREALKNKTRFLVFQNPAYSPISSKRGLRDFQLSTEYFWWVNPISDHIVSENNV